MAIFKLPHFGNIDPAALEEYYDADIDYNGRDIQIDLNFDETNIELERLETVKQFIENIRIHDLKNREYIQNDYVDETADTVKPYLQHHLEDLGEDELAGLLEPGSKPSTYEKQMVKKLHLVRVGIYPHSENQFAIFDYSIGKELTQYLIVINTDENGNLDYMTMES